jgi:hypothetical protein
MNTITRIGSALKRAALYIDRKVIRRHKYVQPQWAKSDQIYYFGTDPRSKIAQIDRMNAESGRAYTTLRDCEHAELDQAVFFGKKD